MLRLHLADYAVFCTILLLFMGIGVSFSFSKASVQDYLHGNHNMAAFPVVLSLATCFFSIVTVQGLAAEVYLYGVASMVAMAAVWGSLLSVFLFIPLLYPLKLTSVYQYLELRYKHTAPKIVAASLGSLSMLSLVCLCIYNPAVTMETITHIPAWVTVVALTAICTCYTALGGFRAVVWSNALQLLLLLLVLSTAASIGVHRLANSWSHGSWYTFKGQDRFKFNLSADPRVRNTVWMTSLALGAAQLSGFTLQPHMMRYTAVQSLTKARVVALLGITVAGVATALSMLLGLLMLLSDNVTDSAYDVIANTTSSYQLVYHYVYDLLPYPGVYGVFVAAVLSASLSYASLLYNGLVAIIWNDVLERFCNSMTDRKQCILLKIFALGIGGLILVVTLTFMWMGPQLYQVVCLVATSCGGAVFGMFLVGAAFPLIGPWGATVGCVIGSMVCLWISCGAAICLVMWQAPPLVTNHTYLATNHSASHLNSLKIYSGFGFDQGPFLVTQALGNRTGAHSLCTWHDLYSLSPYMYHVIGCAIAVISALLISIIPALRQSDTHPKYLFPFVRWVTNRYAIIESEAEETQNHDKHDKQGDTQAEVEPVVQPEQAPAEVHRITESDDESSSSDDVFVENTPESHRAETEEITVEVNNNVQAYRQKSNPDDPALILANILTTAQKSGERNRLISGERHRLISNTRL